ncbi:hypothetical protein V6N13_126562 [Hibiscus sabdariffa]
MAVVLSNAQWGLVFRLLRDGGEVKGNGSPGEDGCLYGTTDGGCLLLGSVFDDGGYVEVLRWGFQSGWELSMVAMQLAKKDHGC